ncbi:MAG: tetratricopeptide repeat protein [bacterium]|nr:tetratricopeptide repeat protein [Candidatus Sumerlaeota bacterium]
MADKDNQAPNAADETALLHGSGRSMDDMDLYQREIERFHLCLDDNMEEAFQRYGFSLFHSLPPLKQIEIAKKIGIASATPLDYYNLGCLDVSREDYKAAVSHFKKALALDPGCADATYNLALCQEKLNHKSEAAELWTRYRELAEDEEDKTAVQAHLAELSA